MKNKLFTMPAWRTGIELYHNLILFLFFSIFLFELIDTSCGIHQHILTGEEWVRRIGNFKLYQRVFIPIVPFYGFFGVSRRAAKKSMAIAHVLEYNQAISLWMNFFFHKSLVCKVQAGQTERTCPL